MKNFWFNKKVLVTGGTGFVGSHVAEVLLGKGARVTVTCHSQNPANVKHLEKDLEIISADLTKFNDAVKATKNKNIVLNLAAKVAGIQYNLLHPAEMFSQNILIAQNMMAAALKNNVERFLVVSSACVYPRYATQPTPESEGFEKDPEPTNIGYGWAKRTAELLGRFYASEYKMKVAIVRPFNAYGPRDNFDPSTSHVIPGIIKRVFDGENPLKVWGSGKQTRSFIYVNDFVRGILLAIEKYPEADPLNIGADEEITIGELVRLIIRLSRKNTGIIFDTSKQDGQPRRHCDTQKTKEKTGFTAKTGLEEGLKKTILWYKHHSLS